MLHKCKNFPYLFLSSALKTLPGTEQDVNKWQMNESLSKLQLQILLQVFSLLLEFGTHFFTSLLKLFPPNYCIHPRVTDPLCYLVIDIHCSRPPRIFLHFSSKRQLLSYIKSIPLSLSRADQIFPLMLNTE